MLNVKIVLRTPVTPGASDGTPTDLRSPLASEEPVTRLPPPASPSPSGGSTDPRTFLMMMAKQKRAEARARRAKRLGLLGLTAAAAVVLLVERHRRADDDGAAANHAVAAPTAETAASEGAPSLSPPAADPAPAATPGTTEPLAPPSSTLPPAPEASAATLVPVAVASTGSAEASARCQESFGQRLWKAAVESCELAFAAQPDAGVALRLAHSYYARGQVDTAGRWASRAVAEGTRDADAYVLIGHAERQAGNDEQAVRAYRRYLRTTPNGWHARNVRAALRGLRARALSRMTPGYTPLSTTATASSLSSSLVPR